MKEFNRTLLFDAVFHRALQTPVTLTLTTLWAGTAAAFPFYRWRTEEQTHSLPDSQSCWAPSDLMNVTKEVCGRSKNTIQISQLVLLWLKHQTILPPFKVTVGFFSSLNQKCHSWVSSKQTVSLWQPQLLCFRCVQGFPALESMDSACIFL